MIEIVAQIFGLTFVGIILICLVWTIMSYIFENKQDNKLIENMKKLNKTTKR